MYQQDNNAHLDIEEKEQDNEGKTVCSYCRKKLCSISFWQHRINSLAFKIIATIILIIALVRIEHIDKNADQLEGRFEELNDLFTKTIMKAHDAEVRLSLMEQKFGLLLSGDLESKIKEMNRTAENIQTQISRFSRLLNQRVIVKPKRMDPLTFQQSRTHDNIFVKVSCPPNTLRTGCSYYCDQPGCVNPSSYPANDNICVAQSTIASNPGTNPLNVQAFCLEL